MIKLSNRPGGRIGVDYRSELQGGGVFQASRVRQPIQTGLVFWQDPLFPKCYPGAGTSIYNMIGGQTGALQNGVVINSLNNLQQNLSFGFDGSNDSVNYGDVHDLGYNDMTISAWVYYKSTSSTAYIQSKTYTGAENYRYAVGIGGTSHKMYIFFQGNGGSDVSVTATTVVPYDTWSFLTFVFQRSSTIAFYYNGERDTVSSGSATISQWNSLNFQSSRPFRVGSYNSSTNTPSGVFTGDISTVLVYHRSLSLDEIRYNYQTTRTRYTSFYGYED